MANHTPLNPENVRETKENLILFDMPRIMERISETRCPNTVEIASFKIFSAAVVSYHPDPDTFFKWESDLRKIRNACVRRAARLKELDFRERWDL